IWSGRGNMIEYSANVDHPLYPELKSLVRKYMGIDKIFDYIIKKMIARLGALDMAFITGDYAEGNDTGIVDLVRVGGVNVQPLHSYVTKAEGMINRKIRTLVLSHEEFEKTKASLRADTALWLWKCEAPDGNTGK